MFENSDRQNTPVSHDLTRRRMLQGAGTVAAAAMAGPAILKPNTAKAAPKQGGILRQALRGGATSDSLDGTTLQAAHPISVSWQVRNNLTEIAPNGDVVGELAESWEASGDAKSWVFKLRKGVEFHNGKSLTAADVVYSLNLHRGENTKSGAAGIVKSVADIRTDGPDTVVVDLSEGNADFAFLMSDYHLVIGPEGTKGKEWDEGIGTGPFILENWEAGVRASTRRNPNYFKEGRPYFDGVETMNIADVVARTNVLKTGEVDVMEEPDLKTLRFLAKTPGITISEVAGTKHFPYPMLLSAPPFENPDVQMALKLAIDREQWVKKVLKGHGYVGNDHPVGRNQKFFAEGLEQRAYDPDKAKHHLKKAGMEGLTVELSAAEVYSGGVDGAVLYQENAKAAGITINVQKLPNDGYWSEVPLNKPWHVSSLAGRPTVDWVMSVSYAAGAPWNDTTWANKRFNELLVQARSELNEGRRGEMYFEMQQLVRDDCPTVIPAFSNFITAMRDNVMTPETVAANSQMDGLKNFERWWFA